jgi:Uma2 family endonuclease
MGEILERPQAPTRHRFDVHTYDRMAEAGVLGDARPVELIDGEIIDMAAVGSPHAAVTNRLARLFTRAVRDDAALVNVQRPLRLDAYNEPQPDVMILQPRADDYRASHPNAADVLLLVEVSETSLAYDRTIKLPLCAKFGVPEVWIVDLVGAAVEVYRELKEGACASRERRVAGAGACLWRDDRRRWPRRVSGGGAICSML